MKHKDSSAAVDDAVPVHPNQFALLKQRRFAPFFWTQFCGAANDNLFKFAFTVMVTYQLQVAWMPPALAGLVIGALFILPFLLFSATSGQLTDKYEKHRMIRFIKNLEIGIMLLAGHASAWPVVLSARTQLERLRRLANQAIRGSEDSLEFHDRITAAVLAGDADQAEALLRQHIRLIEGFLDRLAEIYPKYVA